MNYTLITCTYNASSFLQAYFKVIDSINYEDFEVIIVDDASTDNTYELLLEYTRNSGKHISVFKHQVNKGPGVARNTALQRAIGERILFLDVDDEVDSDILKMSENYKGYDILYFDYNKKYSDDVLHRCSALPLTEGKITDVEFVLATTLGCVWGKVFELSLIKRYSIVFPDLYKSEDLVFLLSYLAHCKNAYYLRQPLYNYRITPNSLVHRNIDNQVDFAFRALDIIRNLPISNDIIDLYYCKEIVYDLSNVYITLGKDRHFLFDFWNANPIPNSWRRIKHLIRKEQLLFLTLIRYKCFHLLNLLVKTKRLYG